MVSEPEHATAKPAMAAIKKLFCEMVRMSALPPAPRQCIDDASFGLSRWELGLPDSTGWLAIQLFEPFALSCAAPRCRATTAGPQRGRIAMDHPMDRDIPSTAKFSVRIQHLRNPLGW